MKINSKLELKYQKKDSDNNSPHHLHKSPKVKYNKKAESEFFVDNSALAGFTGERILYMAIRELIENSLDSCEVHHILPSIFVSIKQTDEGNDLWTISCQDNGIGINSEKVPVAVCSFLTSGKYVEKQQRGLFGVGLKMIAAFSTKDTDKPIKVWSKSIDEDSEYYYELRTDITTNKPIVLNKKIVPKMENIIKGKHGFKIVATLRALSVDVARAVELGVLPGPRVVAAGRVVAMTGGHAWFLGREADGPDTVRHAVRDELKGGASCIKFMASGGVYGHSEEPGAPQLTVEEMRAGVEEAHKAGRKVAAHAYSVEAISNALEAGVDSIEHGSFLDAKTAERMREEGVYLVPTISVYAAMYTKGPELGAPEYIQRKTPEVLDASREAFRLALEIGVPIAAGTDCGAPGHPHGSLPEELRLMVEAGATPKQALRFGTAAAAELLGIGEELGTLEPGKKADLVAVTGNPLQDIDALREVRLVLRGGVKVWPANRVEA